jgi:hypothetical protein
MVIISPNAAEKRYALNVNTDAKSYLRSCPVGWIGYTPYQILPPERWRNAKLNLTSVKKARRGDFKPSMR